MNQGTFWGPNYGGPKRGKILWGGAFPENPGKLLRQYSLSVAVLASNIFQRLRLPTLRASTSPDLKGECVRWHAVAGGAGPASHGTTLFRAKQIGLVQTNMSLNNYFDNVPGHSILICSTLC